MKWVEKTDKEHIIINESSTNEAKKGTKKMTLVDKGKSKQAS